MAASGLNKGTAGNASVRCRDGFLITSTIWVLASFVSAIPFTLADPYLSYTDAVFESVSGLTTTGGTVIWGVGAVDGLGVAVAVVGHQQRLVAGRGHRAGGFGHRGDHLGAGVEHGQDDVHRTRAAEAL